MLLEWEEICVGFLGMHFLLDFLSFHDYAHVVRLPSQRATYTAPVLRLSLLPPSPEHLAPLYLLFILHSISNSTFLTSVKTVFAFYSIFSVMRSRCFCICIYKLSISFSSNFLKKNTSWTQSNVFPASVEITIKPIDNMLFSCILMVNHIDFKMLNRLLE